MASFLVRTVRALNAAIERVGSSAWGLGTLSKLQNFDLQGQVDTFRQNDHKYFLTTGEESQRLIGTRPLKTKAEASECLIMYTKWFDRQTN